MNPNKWKQYQDKLKYPSSLTSTDLNRRVEAEMYVKHATKGWDIKKKLLVLGCGDGYEIELLLKRGWKDVWGVVIDEKEYQRSKDLGLNVVLADVHEMPFKDEEFDYVISKETLEHMLSPFIALGEINRVMKPGAKFVHYIPEGREKQKDWYHVCCAPRWLWEDLMVKTGFYLTSVTDDILQVRYEGKKNIG